MFSARRRYTRPVCAINAAGSIQCVQGAPELVALPVLIKKYECQTDNELVLSQYNPPKELRYSIESVMSIHVAVGTSYPTSYPPPVM